LRRCLVSGALKEAIMVDIKDVPRDAVLPWLHLATDGEAMRRRLQPHFGDRIQLLQVKVGRFTY
jgi:hypothetical protein